MLRLLGRRLQTEQSSLQDFVAEAPETPKHKTVHRRQGGHEKVMDGEQNHGSPKKHNKHAVRHHFHKLLQQLAVVTDHAGILTKSEAGGDGNLRAANFTDNTPSEAHN